MVIYILLNGVCCSNGALHLSGVCLLSGVCHLNGVCILPVIFLSIDFDQNFSRWIPKGFLWGPQFYYIGSVSWQPPFLSQMCNMDLTPILATWPQILDSGALDAQRGLTVMGITGQHHACTCAAIILPREYV